MKKFIALLTALILSLSLMVPAAFAEEEEETDTGLEIRILGNDGDMTASYRDELIVEAYAYGLSSSEHIEIEIFGSDGYFYTNEARNGDYDMYIVTDELKGQEYTVYAEICDEDGLIITEDQQQINVKTNFFAKLIAFFRIDVFGVKKYAENSISAKDTDFKNKCKDYYDFCYTEYDTDFDFSVLPQTVEEIVAYYNEARKVSAWSTINGYQDMSLVGDITGDGSFGTVLKTLSPAVKKALSNNSKNLSGIPGCGCNDILVSDVKNAEAKTDENGNVVITIEFKDQTDGPDADDKNGGPVARGIGTLGSIDTALSELGARFSSGRDTVKLEYTDAYIRGAVIDTTGHIHSAAYHYTVKLSVGYAKVSIGSMTSEIQNLAATIGYTRTVG